MKNLKQSTDIFGFPCFIKPIKGIRSEWARWISNKLDVDQYIKDTKKYFKSSETFILEEALEGYEVDADLVLYNGNLLYSAVSDNFPIYAPFSLETGHLMPSILDTKTQNRIIKHAYRCVKACGYNSGVFHVELILKSDGQIALLEVNGRMGGMYISKWHKEIWDVDLIKAELAISSGVDPTPFLHKKTARKAMAQVCITTNTTKDLSQYGNNLKIREWINFQELQKFKDICTVKKWVDFPYERNISTSGHPNIGEIIVEAESPLLAFQKLSRVYRDYPPSIITNNGVIQPSTTLEKFCFNTPNINRFIVRQATSSDSDKESILKLLTLLTERVSPSLTDAGQMPDIPNMGVVLLVEDTMMTEKPVVGMISLYQWTRMRPYSPDSCYIHDLIIQPNYRKLGLAKKLIKELLNVARRKGISKVELACDEDKIGLYTKFGFSPVGTHLAQYLKPYHSKVSDNQVFNQEEIKLQGELVYGNGIVEKYIIPNDRKIILPKHFFIPIHSDPKVFLKDICSSKKRYAIKYSLHDDAAFSYERERGANSSRGRTLDVKGCSSKDVLLKINSFIKSAPVNCSGLLLQELIGQTGGCLFHAEFSHEGMETELLWENSTGRAYSFSKILAENIPHSVYEEIEGPGNPVNRRESCKKIETRCKKIFDNLFKIRDC